MPANDGRPYAALREAADEAETAGRAPEAVKEARELLGARASAIAQFCSLDDNGTLPGKEGATGVRRVSDARWEAIQSLRRGMAAVFEELNPR